MKAIVLKGFGGVENLQVTDLPQPVISDSEVLVNIMAIGVNPVDIKTRKGKGLARALKDFDPIIPGWDISGTVVDTGKNVTGFKNGDEVFGMINFPGHGKAYAEFAAAPASHVALKPPDISHQEAAGASLAALTAWQILKEKVNIKPSDKVLIHAAAGGVGHFAVQMARHLGAAVTGTASAENKDFILSLGATAHVDYENEVFEEVLHDFDFVLDTIGGTYIDRSLKVLRKGGTIVCIPSDSAVGLEEKAAAKGMNGARFLVQSDGNNMKEISELLEKGIIKSFISRIYRLDKVREAHIHIEMGKTRGKIVLVP